MGLSRVTTIEGLYITNLGEDKIAVSNDVCAEMSKLRTERKLRICVTPVYKAGERPFKLCYLNTRSLNKHFDDIYRDFNHTSTVVNVLLKHDFVL